MQLPSHIRIGTRKSTLAIAQAEILRASLMRAFPAVTFELVPMLTTGDRNTDKTLADIGGKGLFTKELEEDLLAGRVDIAVHSLKDMETFLPPGLIIGAVLPREDPRDALVAIGAKSLGDLPNGARIGTSSPRRTAQLKIARPDIVVVPFRGNVTTRLDKLKSGVVDATILALAGLKRIGLEKEITEILDAKNFIPAAGQGTIAIECKEENVVLHEMLGSIQHIPTHYATLAERSMLAAIDGSCRTPIGAYAQVEKGLIKLVGMVARADGSEYAHVMREGDAKDAAALGKDAGAELLKRGVKSWFA